MATLNAESQSIQHIVNPKSDNPPHLEKQGTATRLIVKGKPFLMLAGELHNSSTSNTSYMRPIWAHMAKIHLNTVIAPVSWELIEDQKGRFDFSLPDSMIMGARKQGLHLILTWFGSWKNSSSTYAPSWVKKNFHQFPYVKDQSGKTLEILSTFGEATWEADANALRRLMAHIKEIDKKQQTVIMVQVENESGVLLSNRDYSDDANKAFLSDIPAELSTYLTTNKNNLAPELYSVWKANGFKTKGNWESVFGKSSFDSKDWKKLSYYTEELFMAYYYAKYIGIVANTGKSAYRIPMYVNAWLKQPETPYPGKYPSGGPLPQVIDMYRCAAKAIDFIAPDIYIPQFTWVTDQFHRLGNPLMIPETRGGAWGAASAFYAFGEHDAMCFSPFGIDGDYSKNAEIKNAYMVLDQLKEIILKNQGKQTMRGILIDTTTEIQRFNLGGYQIEARLLDKNKNHVEGGIIINTAPEEYLIAGKGLDIRFTPATPERLPLVAIEIANEGSFKNGKWVKGRTLNGNEINTSIFSGTGLKFPSKSYTIQFVRLYRYE